MTRVLRSILNFSVRRHRALLVFGVSLTMIHLMSGCAGTFLADAPNVIDVVLASLSSLLGVIGIVSPQATAISAVINTVITEIQGIQTLIADYKTTPNETTLQKVEQAIQEVVANLNPLLSPLGVSGALASKIGSIVQIILGQLTAWAGLFPAAAPTTPTATTANFEVAHVAALAEPKTITLPKPMHHKDLEKLLTATFHAPTGDTLVDSATSTVPKL